MHVIFVDKNPLLLLTGLHGWFLGTVDSRFRGNDSGVVGVINGETIANGPKNLPTILTGTRGTLMAGFSFAANGGGDGATISHLRFETVEFPVFSRGADNVTVDHCAFANSIQAVTNWHGSSWEITHNVIQDLQTRNGGGIGILCGCVQGGNSNDNVISHNKITGTLHVEGWYPNPDTENGGYNGTGIVLYADYRYQYPAYPGADQIASNRIVKNKISLVVDDPRTAPINAVDVVAIELTDTRNDEDLALDVGIEPSTTNAAIYDNAIGFNDFRGTETQIVLTPEDLENHNTISKNLGKNRGHGLHPSVFGPGEN